METQTLLAQAKRAGQLLATFTREKIDAVIGEVAKETILQQEAILEANRRDLARMSPDDPKYDRLALSEERLKGIAADLGQVTRLPSPLQRVLEERELPNGLLLKKITVPIGVIGVIYEARPNVTFDVFGLTLKSGNACVLKGGSDAIDSNTAIVAVIRKVLKAHGLPEGVATLLPPDRQATAMLLQAVGMVDLIIPRGSQQLIDYVRQHAKVPVVETGAGIVHVYFDASGDLAKGKAVIMNAKTRRVSVCNALDCLLLHESRLAELPALVADLASRKVQLYADGQALEALSGYYPAEWLHPATAEHFGTEFLDYKMAIKTVTGIEEAMEHVRTYSSRHSEAIIAEDEAALATYQQQVDAAVVYLNASTAFTDGAQFGMGAEIGISTQKLHARGPMALAELTSYKWVARGNGQVRPA